MRGKLRQLDGRTAFSAVLLTLVGGVLWAQRAGNRVPARPADCQYGSWSSPRLLEKPDWFLSGTRSAGMASMEAVDGDASDGVARASAYVVGVAGLPSAELSGVVSPGQWPPQLHAFSVDGRRVDGPAGQFWFAYPRAALDGSGNLHVVWGEPDVKLPADPALLHGHIPPVHSLWHAMLRQGRWSRPHLVFRGLLAWDNDNTSRLIADSHGTLHVAAVGSDTADLGNVPGILYLRSDSPTSGQWRATTAIRPSGIYLDLAVDRDQRAAISFIAGGGATPRPNVLFVVRTSDGGTTWSHPVEVSTPEDDPAYEVHAFFDSDRALRMTWVQQPLGEMTGGKLWYSILSDAGRRASASLALPSRVITSHSQAAIDACGTIHFIRQWYGRGVSELRYARVDEGGWSEFGPAFPFPGGHMSLTTDDSTVHVVWQNSSRSVEDTTQFRYGLAYSRLPLFRTEHARHR